MSFRTLKPFQLGLMFRTVDRRGASYGCFSLLTIVARDGIPLLRSEPSLWKTLAQHAPEFVESGVIKSQPEFLLFGHAHAYDGATEGVVGIQLAGTRKWCRVFGARVYPNAMRAAPFDRVRLDWRKAYGGPDFAANPLGIGREKDDAGNILVPHLELEGAPWRPDSHGQLAVGFGPLDAMHPERAKRVGTYDDDWLKTDFPGMARDADWRFFQTAPPDQWLDSDIRGDESFTLLGLHPVERIQHGRLPGFRPRVFMERRHERQLIEVECRLRTIVFLPDADAVIQIWQGITKVDDEDASEVTHVLAGLEALAEPKPESHYASVFASRLDDQGGMLAMLRDEDLLPDGTSFESLLPTDLNLNKPAPADSLRGRLEQKNRLNIEAVRAEVASHGLDPDLHAPPLPGPRVVIPPLHELAAYLRELDHKAQQQIQAAQTSQRKVLEQTAAEFAARGESFDYVLKEISTTPTGPPRLRTPDRLDELRNIRAHLAATGSQVDEIDHMLADTDLQKQWRGDDQTLQTAYEQSAHFQNPAARTAGRAATRQKSWVNQRLLSGQPLRGYDLTGADLREFDLRGANLDGAMMEAVCLDGVDLTGASAKGAVLAHASFVNARLDDCDLTAANLGRASCVSTSACRAVFTRAILFETNFSNAVLQGANFSAAETLYVKFAGADLSGALLDEVLLYQTDLSRTRLNDASIHGVQFLDNNMVATDFTGVRGHKAVFMNVNGENLCFDGADLSGAMFVQEPRLPHASMRGAKLTKAFLHGADLTGATLSHANLDSCELGRSTLVGANLRGASAFETGLRFADLSQAQVVGADLRGALLANAKLFGARFDASSFFMADLSRVQIDTNTSFEHVNLGRARIFPRWQPPMPASADSAAPRL